MSIEALWTVRFGPVQSSEMDLNGGVAMIESGRIFGGDSSYAYLGTIELAGQAVKGELSILQHQPGTQSMYGRNEERFTLTFTGTRVGEDRVEGSLHRPGFPSARLLLKRLAPLP